MKHPFTERHASLPVLETLPEKRLFGHFGFWPLDGPGLDRVESVTGRLR